MEPYETQVREQIRDDKHFHLLLLRELEYYQTLLADKNLPPGTLNQINARLLREETFRRYQKNIQESQG